MYKRVDAAEETQMPAVALFTFDPSLPQWPSCFSSFCVPPLPISPITSDASVSGRTSIWLSTGTWTQPQCALEERE